MLAFLANDAAKAVSRSENSCGGLGGCLGHVQHWGSRGCCSTLSSTTAYSARACLLVLPCGSDELMVIPASARGNWLAISVDMPEASLVLEWDPRSLGWWKACRRLRKNGPEKVFQWQAGDS